MKAKLIKTIDEQGVMYSLSGDSLPDNYVLSDKNCQEIELGYDLDELLKSKYPNAYNEDFEYDSEAEMLRDEYKSRGFYEGAKAIIEILGDKKFSEEDMHEAIRKAKSHDKTPNHEDIIVSFNYSKEEIIQSLQQTEWDVDVCCHVEEDNGWLDADTFNSPMLISTGEPKLDVDGCLILKRV